MEWQVTQFLGNLSALQIVVRDFLEDDLSTWAARRAKIVADGDSVLVFYRADGPITPSKKRG